jgi:hypothetical protein
MLLIFIIFNFIGYASEEFLKITVNVDPKYIKQGQEGELRIEVMPKSGIKISSHPEFMIILDPNDNLSFSKPFFTASELDFKTKEENGKVFYELEGERSIHFKVKESSLIGRHKISGKVIFTAVFSDNWSYKTNQKFEADFIAKKNLSIRKK